MKNGQQNWEKLKNMPDEYAETPALAQKAMAEIAARQNQRKRSWLVRSWKAIAACAACFALLLSVGIPLYEKFSAPQVVYFEVNDIVYEETQTPTEYVCEKGVNVLHFDTAAIMVTRGASIIETNEFAYLMQETVQMNDAGGLDKVNFWGVAKKNAEFNFFKKYEVLENVCIIKDISIRYEMVLSSNTLNNQILARFSYQGKVCTRLGFMASFKSTAIEPTAPPMRPEFRAPHRP